MHPVLLELGVLKLHSYGLMIICAISFGFFAGLGAGARFRAPLEKVIGAWSVAFGAFAIGAIVGSAIDRPGPFDPRHAGFLFVPGVFAGALAAIGIARVMRAPFGSLLDAVGSSALVGFGVGRIGCFLAGCCAGTPTALPWGVHFPETTTVIPAELRGAALHPTQLYQSGVFLAAAIALFVLGPRLAPGRTGATALAVIAATSLATAPIRCDPPSTAGIVAWVVLLLGALAAAIFTRSSAKYRTAAA